MRLGIVTRRVRRNDGQGRVNYEIALEALRRGHELTLFASEVDRDLLRDPNVQWLQINVSKWPTRLLKVQIFAIQSLLHLYNNVHTFDVLIANGFTSWRSADVNLVHFVHRAWLRSPVHPLRLEWNIRTPYQGVYTAVGALQERWAFSRSRIMVAVSSQVRKELVASGVPEDLIVVVPNGVDTREFAPGPGDRARFSLPDDAVIALFAGDLQSSRKNLDGVLKALREVPAVHLAVAGHVRGSRFPQLAKELGVSDRAHFLDYQPDMPALMRSVDFFVFPSRYEPFGLVLLEASAAGLPVITTRRAGGSELLTGESSIILDETEDIGALAEAVRRIAEDAQLRRTMALAGRAIAERHTWASCAKQHVELLEGVLARASQN